MNQTLFAQIPRELQHKIFLMELNNVFIQRETGFWPNDPAPWPPICGHKNKSQCRAHWEYTYSIIDGVWYAQTSYWDGLHMKRLTSPISNIENRCRELFPRLLK
jgi:hypothetical protein